AVLGAARRATPTEGGPQQVAAEMEGSLRDAAETAGLEPAELAGVGVGAPGTSDGAHVSKARNLPRRAGALPLRGARPEALGCEVRVGNDVQVATAAEFKLGAGREYKSLLGVFWGTGVGGGLVFAGEMWKGRGGAGEIGHVVVEIDGARCSCGRRGCMEAYAG